MDLLQPKEGRQVLRILVVLVALWGLGVGLYDYMRSLVLSIKIMDSESASHTAKMYDILGALQIMSFEYEMSMIIMFSAFLLYGTIREIPEKSMYILPWIVYAAVSDTNVLLSIISIALHPHIPVILLLDAFILIGIQTGVLVMVFLYYRKLPKKEFAVK